MHEPELIGKTRLAFVGLPGSGKSSVGRLLAQRLCLRFVDSDAAIERSIGESIRRFFEREGEARFRDIEAAVLESLCADADVQVLSTGGGAILREENRLNLQRAFVIVYLRASPDELYRRLRHDTQRPLLQVPDPRAALSTLYDQRDPLYRAVAAFTIETGRPTVKSLVATVLMQLELAGHVEAGAASALASAKHAKRPMPRSLD